MSTVATPLVSGSTHPVHVDVRPTLDQRNRLTTAFRLFLAIPHLLLVGAPIAGLVSWTWESSDGRYEVGMGGGALGVVAGLATVIAWFAIVFAGRSPGGLWDLVAYYMRWRVRAV